MPETVKFSLNRILKFKFGENWQENKKWLFITLALLAIIVFVGVYIRTTNISQLKDVTTGNYTLGPDLDPFLYLRVAKEVVDYGKPLNPDYMRYLGTKPYTDFIVFAMAYLYKFLTIFSSSISLEYVAIIIPVIFFGASIIFFFLVVRKIFHKKPEFQKNLVSIFAAALYAVIPLMQHRTTAGIPEIESPGLVFFWLAFLFFLYAWEAKPKEGNSGKLKNILNKQSLFALLSGIFTGFMIYTWGGFKFIFLSISLAVLVAFILGKIRKKEILIYFLWYLPALIVQIYKFGFGALSDPTVSVLPLFVSLILVISLVMNDKIENKIRDITKIRNLSKEIISVALALIAGIILGMIAKPSLILNLIPTVIERLLYPYGRGRVGLTVAENAQPYITDWISSFGNVFFWLFLIGTVALFYETTRDLGKKYKWILNSSFVLLLAGFVFSRYSSDSLLNGTNFISQLFYFGSIGIFIISFIYSYLKMPKEDRHKIEFSYLWILSLIFIMILASRGAVRLLFISSSVFIIPVAFLPIFILKLRSKSQDNLWKFLLLMVCIISVLLMSIIFINYTKETSQGVEATVPSSYSIQWQMAMAWVRNNTAVGSIFIHWWDYGYWIQTMGERPTVTDGGHDIGYWDHLTGRYLLTTPKPETAFSLMKTYNVSYLLIDSTDLGKYSAYSSIGSDESRSDRYSTIPVIQMDSSQTQTANDSTILVYRSVVPVDSDILVNSTSGQVFLPSGKSYLIAVLIKMKNTSQLGFEQASAVFYYNGQQIQVPMRYIYSNNQLIDFGSGFEGAAYVLPVINSVSSNHIQIDDVGSIIYLSPKVFNSLFAQLYLMNDPFNQYQTINLAYSQDSSPMENLKSSGGFEGDFVYYNGFIGPIKIWKVNYPENTKTNQEFLRTEGGYAEFDNLTFTK